MAWRDRWILKSDINRQYYEGMAVFLLIVFVMCAIIYTYTRASEAANKIVCAGRLRQLSQAMVLYSVDYDGLYPPSDGWSIALSPYVDNLNSFLCPSDKKGYLRRKKSKLDVPIVSYWYRMPKSDDPNHIVSGDRVYENFDGNHANGGNVLYMDGHTRWKTPEEWVKEKLPFEPY